MYAVSKINTLHCLCTQGRMCVLLMYVHIINFAFPISCWHGCFYLATGCALYTPIVASTNVSWGPYVPCFASPDFVKNSDRFSSFYAVSKINTAYCLITLHCLCTQGRMCVLLMYVHIINFAFPISCWHGCFYLATGCALYTPIVASTNVSWGPYVPCFASPDFVKNSDRFSSFLIPRKRCSAYSREVWRIDAEWPMLEPHNCVLTSYGLAIDSQQQSSHWPVWHELLPIAMDVSATGLVRTTLRT